MWVDPGVQALLAEADVLVQAGDSVQAGERIVAAYGRVMSDDDRLAVAEAAGRALAAVQPTGLMGWAEGAIAQAGPDRPWVRRALALGLAGQRRYAEASAVARALADEGGAGDVAESHRARGLGLLVRFAVAAGDSAGAWASLADLAAVDPEGAAEAVLSVAVAFSDTAEGRGPEFAAGSAKADPTAPESNEAIREVLSAGPNPSSGAVRVSLELAGPSFATVAVFDALGREVAVLHDGVAVAGSLDLTFDGTRLPAGLYIVRAVVRADSGRSAVLTRTVVVAR